MMPDLPEDDSEKLINRIKTLGPCIVAFSGGVDSSVVSKAAVLALGSKAKAAIAVSPSLAEREYSTAQKVADQIGIELLVIHTEELASPGYRANAGDRCFFCKDELYSKIRNQFESANGIVVLNGTNIDDLGDYRPGLQAANNHNVVSPLVDCQLGKQRVREIAKKWGLSVWNKPAAPCLASRIAYHETVDAEKLKMIERAEELLFQNGHSDVRVRFHANETARIEVPASELSHLLIHRESIIRRFKEIGFNYVTIDLEGLRSGNMNQLLVQIGSNTDSTETIDEPGSSPGK